MDKKVEEMIALGVSYGINCTFCMEYHKKKAVEAGLTEEEMLAVLSVAEQVKTGAASKTKAVAKQLFGEPEENECCSSDSPCCP
ncbi:MAG: carboxymuconolactone decarboxylase family protein [Planctomycetota bacterium]|jgi:AhpD family alkylhydroperoxidase